MTGHSKPSSMNLLRPRRSLGSIPTPRRYRPSSSSLLYVGSAMRSRLPLSTRASVTARMTTVFPKAGGAWPTKTTPFVWRASNIRMVISCCVVRSGPAGSLSRPARSSCRLTGSISTSDHLKGRGADRFPIASEYGFGQQGEPSCRHSRGAPAVLSRSD